MSIQEWIDESLAKKEVRVRSGKFSPSSFGRCYRLQYWNRKDEPKTNPPDERTERVFKAGNLFHEFVQDTIIAHHPKAQKEVLIEDADFKGYADLVIDDEVIDIKSQHSRAFWYRSGKPWSEVEPMIYTNILQVMWYAINLGKPKARLCFISKDDCCIQEFGLEVNDKWKTELSQEVNVLMGYWEFNQLPPATPRAYGVDKKTGAPKDCEYCSWKDLCIKTEKENAS